ncbi:MAG: hypothetical protein QOE82_1017, partial [Thermoanaerobaculia bacterium]|nr:hypothetical protein [Thermoanaerobaculia bacterium]
MTLLLAHPTDENLGRFVEGTLEEPERAAIVAHIADCDDCRILVVDSATFTEPAKTESRKWWMGVAASIVIAAGSYSFWSMSQEPLTAMIEDSAKVSNGPIESRLHAFRYGPRRTNRGGDDETETAVYNLQGKAAEVLDRKGDAPKIVHARGVAHLLIAATARQNDQIDISAERKEAIASLVDA